MTTTDIHNYTLDVPRPSGCETEKRHLWYAVLNLERDAEGHRDRQWSMGFKAEAERALARLLVDERVAKEARYTVKYVVDQYITNDRTSHGQRSPTTTQGYGYQFHKVEPLYVYRVDALDGATIERFYDGLRQDGLSDTTVHHVHNLLFASFKWAKRRKVALITPQSVRDLRYRIAAPFAQHHMLSHARTGSACR